MAKAFAYFGCIVFAGCFGYLLIISLYRELHRRSLYDPLKEEYISPRPPNTYLRLPWKLLDGKCSNTTCLQGKHVNWTIITFIKSKADYCRRREVLRRTWTTVNYLNGARFEAVFLIGKANNEATEAILDEENARYGDILQYDGSDDYNKMPYKVLAGMEWAAMNLNETFLYASADDDFIVDVLTLSRNMTYIYDEFKNDTNYFPIVCLFIRGIDEKPLRIHSKWRVTYAEYKSTTYPSYCHGGMYVTSLKVAKNLFIISRTSPMLRLDDVWITGILRERMNLSADLVYFLPQVARHFGFVNDAVAVEMVKQWKVYTKLLSNSSMCTCTL